MVSQLGYLVLLPGGVLLDNGLQDSPVCTRLIFGDAAAALQVQGVHLLADMIPKLGLLPPHLLLEGRDCWAWRDRSRISQQAP